MDTITSQDALLILKNIVSAIQNNVEYLTQLDQAIGDGDHGINLRRGFQAVLESLEKLTDKDVGEILKSVGMTLVSNVGGAIGPLYGMAFMKAGDLGIGKTEVDLHDVVKMFEAAEQAIIMMGKANVGEKTMLDAIHPAVKALQEAKEQHTPLIDAFRRGVEAAGEGVKNTITMVSKRGRSSYLGERSKGHQDVGATSSYIILNSALNTLSQLQDKK